MNDYTYWDCMLPLGDGVRVQGRGLKRDEVMVMINALQVYRETWESGDRKRAVHRRPIRAGIAVEEDIPVRL